MLSSPNQVLTPPSSMGNPAEEHRAKIRAAHEEGGLQPGSEKELSMVEAMQAASRAGAEQRAQAKADRMKGASEGSLAAELRETEEGSQGTPQGGKITVSKAGDSEPQALLSERKPDQPAAGQRVSEPSSLPTAMGATNANNLSPNTGVTMEAPKENLQGLSRIEVNPVAPGSHDKTQMRL